MYVAEMRPLAKKYQEYLQFTTIDPDEYPHMLPSLGLKPGSTRVLSVQNPSNGDVFPYTGGDQGEIITAAVVEAFLLDIINGRVRAFGRDSDEGAGTNDGTDHRRHDEL